MTGWIDNDLDHGFQIIERTWYFQENHGNVDNVLISFSSGSLPVFVGNLYMLVDTGSESFDSDEMTFYTGTFLSGLWQFSVNMPDDAYVTFAYIDQPYAPTAINLAST